MKLYLTIMVMLFFGHSFAQKITGAQLLEKAIQYHDPNNAWSSFKGQLSITMETPKSSNRISEITLNLPARYFKTVSKREQTTRTYEIDKGKCIISKKDSVRIANLKTPPERSHCETSTMYKNYYTYLYGLPMKLKNPGTHIDPIVETKTFKGKAYLVLKASYDEEVGSDVWYFYFNPVTYAMEVYQFYKGDPKGAGKDTGEYILLSDMEILNGIKIPKKRDWYYNKNDEYLGTDLLTKLIPLSK